jgi:hypothetical protein
LRESGQAGYIVRAEAGLPGIEQDLALALVAGFECAGFESAT